jgi:predicted DNA-binding transcriptional regulator AlpA
MAGGEGDIRMADNPQVVVTTPEQLKALIAEAVRDPVGVSSKGDRLLDPEEAAKLLSVSEDWLYHQAKRLPFTRKLGPRLLRFSYQGIVKWMDSKKFGSVK